jgi:Holliday junction resolvase RusA-like endonuclease
MDGQPVGKGRPRFSRVSGTVYTPEKTARYEERLAWAAQNVMAGRPLLTGALKVEIFAWVTIPVSKSKKFKLLALAQSIWPTSKPDVDNFGKCIDALNKIVWVDDAQIVDLHVYKRYTDRPHLAITVEEK